MSERKIVDYIVEYNTTTEDLKDEIMERIEEGYVLQGGICVTDLIDESIKVKYEKEFSDARYQTWFYQAMVKYED